MAFNLIRNRNFGRNEESELVQFLHATMPLGDKITSMVGGLADSSLSPIHADA